MNTRYIKYGLMSLGALVLFLVLAPFTMVGSGQRGVVTHFGKVQETVLDEGLHFTMPIMTSVKKISVRVQKTETGSEAASKDMQKVNAKLALNWHVDPTSVNKLYQTVGDEDDIVQQIINPAVSEVLKSATAKMTAEEILTKRIELKQNIDSTLTARLKNYNVLVDDVSLVDLDFTDQFNHAVESKQVSEQRTKQAEYEAQKAAIDAKAATNKAEGEAKSALIRAKAEAEANQLKLRTLTSELIRYEAIQRWDGKLPSVSGSVVPFINIDNLKEAK